MILFENEEDNVVVDDLSEKMLIMIEEKEE